MPSKSRRTSMVDGEYEWEAPEEHSSSGKKSRSKLPVAEKLNVSSQLSFIHSKKILAETQAHQYAQKRRDQNRVSQRAFRQRKEKHTKELELKVEELESLLETASQENNMVATQMSKMEEELCYYRRVLFTGAANSNPIPFTPASSETPASYSGAWPQQTGSVPASNGSSSSHSSPTLSNIPGDFGPGGGVESFWGYDVQTSPVYQDFKFADTTAFMGQGQW